MPSRPSGERKEQETAENEGGAGTGSRRPGQSAQIEALRHCQKPSKTKPLQWRRPIDTALTGEDRAYVADLTLVSQGVRVL